MLISPDYHPEVDEIPLLSPEMGSKYRILVGSALWVAMIGRHDVLYAMNTFVRYNGMPREVHSNGMLKVFGYLNSFCKAKLVFDTRDFMKPSNKVVAYCWKKLYPNAEEVIPSDVPILKMKPVTISSIYNASHAPCLITRRSVIRIALLIKNTLFRNTSTRQNMVESATYGAEMVAGCFAVDQVMTLRYTSRMLGVPVKNASVLLGDNQSGITSCTLSSSNLKKKHNAIAYHCIMEAVAAGIIELRYLKNAYNLTDSLTIASQGYVHYKLWES